MFSLFEFWLEGVWMGDSFRVSLVEKHHPRTGNFVLLHPLRKSAFTETCYAHHLSPPAHDFDNLVRVHAIKFRYFYTLSQELSRPRFRIFLL